MYSVCLSNLENHKPDTGCIEDPAAPMLVASTEQECNPFSTALGFCVT